jgi:hypothetical protein
MRRGALARAHLVQHDADAGLGDLPGGFRAGQAAADDVNRVDRHARRSTLRRRRAEGLTHPRETRLF